MREQGESGGGGTTRRGRSCKGCLYYSSLQKSKSEYPTCVGFYKTLDQQVPTYIVGETELEASKADRTLTHFNYACLGYSVFLDSSTTTPQNTNNSKVAELPFCAGLEVLYDRNPAGEAHDAATPVSKTRDNGQPNPQPPSYKQHHSTGVEYLTRLKRNAGLVASGVATNLNRVGHHIKQSVDNIFRRSK